MGFTDIHAHFLCGIDDGPRSVAEMAAMLDAAQAEGIEILFATPHVTPGVHPIHEGEIKRRIAQAQRYCQQNYYGLTVFQGAEILYTPALENYMSEKWLPTLAGTESVLIEFVPDIEYPQLDNAIDMLERAGYRPIIAHAERYRCLLHAKNALRLKEYHDVRYQVNCQTVLKMDGHVLGGFLSRWLKLKLIDFVATDAHDCSSRPFRMRAAYHALARLVGWEYASQMMKSDTI